VGQRYSREPLLSCLGQQEELDACVNVPFVLNVSVRQEADPGVSHGFLVLGRGIVVFRKLQMRAVFFWGFLICLKQFFLKDFTFFSKVALLTAVVFFACYCQFSFWLTRSRHYRWSVTHVDLDCSGSVSIAAVLVVDGVNEEERVLVESLNVMLQVLLGTVGADDDLRHFDAKHGSVKEPLQQVEDKGNDSEIDLLLLLLVVLLLLLLILLLLILCGWLGLLLVGNEFCQSLENHLLFLGGCPVAGQLDLSAFREGKVIDTLVQVPWGDFGAVGQMDPVIPLCGHRNGFHREPGFYLVCYFNDHSSFVFDDEKSNWIYWFFESLEGRHDVTPEGNQTQQQKHCRKKSLHWPVEEAEAYHVTGTSSRKVFISTEEQKRRKKYVKQGNATRAVSHWC
jgi:hypothetical protein